MNGRADETESNEMMAMVEGQRTSQRQERTRTRTRTPARQSRVEEDHLAFTIRLA